MDTDTWGDYRYTMPEQEEEDEDLVDMNDLRLRQQPQLLGLPQAESMTASAVDDSESPEAIASYTKWVRMFCNTDEMLVCFCDMDEMFVNFSSVELIKQNIEV